MAGSPPEGKRFMKLTKTHDAITDQGSIWQPEVASEGRLNDHAL